MTRDKLTHEIIAPERYELLAEPVHRFELNRREFVGALGAGLLFTATGGVSLGQRRSGSSRSSKISDRLHVGADGTITAMTGKVEVGQGARTQITQAIAEELRVSPGRIRLIMGDTELCPNDGGTFGSQTTPRTIPVVRRAAAAARELLLDLAAAELKAPRDSLTVKDGVIFTSADKQGISYADLARTENFDDRFELEVGNDVQVTQVSEWKVLSTPLANVRAEDVVTGAKRYPSDIVRPGMLYGAVLRAPSYGATLKSIDLAPAESIEGVTAVRDGDFVGCAAPTSFLAAKAVEAIAATADWDQPPQPSSKDLTKHLKEHAQTGAPGGRRPRVQTAGSVKEGLASSAKTLSATYEISYIQHVPMEPRAAVAEFADGKLTAWTGSQVPTRVKSELTRAFRLSADKVRVIIPDTGGGFGGKHTGEVALEAARLAKAAGKPVSLRWSREEEFTWAYFRPGGVIEIEAGLDDENNLIAWDFANYLSGASAIRTPYDVPNVRTQFIGSDSPLRTGSYRALASTANTFARESFMDELAALAGVDPLDFRLEFLRNDRLRTVLQAAAMKFDWSRMKEKSAPNRGVGIACGTEKASYVAACAEVEVDPETGRVKVVQAVVAFECGAILNPLNLKAQVEGGIIMGLGGALTEEIRFEGGKILNPRFSEYRVPRMEDMPEIETVLLDRPDLPSVGAGETPIIAIAPAIGNAVFDATGVRVRSLPIKPELVKA